MLGRRRIAGLLLAGAMSAGLTLAALPASATTNYYEIFSGVATILCLQPAGGSGDAGTPIVQEPCNTGKRAQNWAPAGLGGGSSYEFVNQQTGERLGARPSAAGTAGPRTACRSGRRGRVSDAVTRS